MNRAALLCVVLLFARPASGQIAETAAEVVAPPTESVEEPLTDLIARARAEDARTEYESAVALYEAYASRCLASSTAVLEACAEVAPSLVRAFELARALGDTAAAERVAASFIEHLLYAHPRDAIRVGYDLARLHFDAGRYEAAEAALDLWIELHPDPPAGQAILLDAMRARLAMSTGQHDRATALFRRVERRFSSEPIGEDAAVPLALVHEAVAEARLLRADAAVERFLATGLPRAQRVDDEDAWWARVITPWRVRVQRRLLLARVQLEQVYELGSPRHSVIAAARIGEMYVHLANLHATLELPDDPWIRALVTNGEDQRGYDTAVAHLETCVSWARHHGVARRWAERCERALHALDPSLYPLAAELSGHATYIPASVATPPTPR